ncbi:MAG: DNA replication and repair protein RecF [Chthoniobacterales bacterium]|nr:DNA replication and repair protein RecF [Chthoniobacterales bacterium]
MLTDLRLRDFRCFDALEIFPGPGRTFVLGENAQGKTSILEAICVLLRLQSPRTTATAETIRFGRDRFCLDGHFSEVHLRLHYSSEGREMFLDSKPQARTEDYLDVARVAWFANTDLELVRGGGSGRRRYLDFLGIQCLPGYRKSLRAYEKALRSRNALLKDNRPRREIEAFDPPLIEAGDFLLGARRRLCEALAPLAESACREISGGDDALEISCRSGAEGPLAEALTHTRAEEMRLRQTHVGPHRDDLKLLLNGRDAAGFASEGQQRGIALALKLAQARHLEAVQNRAPILLLDDIFGELDPVRRNRLLASLPPHSQTIITTTFLDWADRQPQDIAFRLVGGRLENA